VGGLERRLIQKRGRSPLHAGSTSRNGATSSRSWIPHRNHANRHLREAPCEGC
jgi:hypothetical protein